MTRMRAFSTRIFNDPGQILTNASQVLISESSTFEQKKPAHDAIANYICQTAPKANGADYRVMSYNILRDGDGWNWDALTEPKVGCARRVEILCAIVDGYQPDVIGFTERYDCWEEEAALTSRLQDYGYAVAQSEMPTDIKNTYWLTADRDYNRNLLAYNDEIFDFVSAETVAIQDFATMNYRSVTCLLLHDTVKDWDVAFFVTHWEAQDRDKPHDEMLAENAEKMSAQIIGFLNGKGDIPAVAIGDFNAESSHGAYKKLLNHCAFSDVTAFSTEINHMMTKNCTVLAAQKDTEPYTGYMSDHKPIYCDIKIGG